MTPDPDDDIRQLLRRRAGSIQPRGTYDDLDRKLAEAPAPRGRWQRPLLLGVAAVLAVLVGAGVTALATRDPDRPELDAAGSIRSDATSKLGSAPTSTTAPPTTTAPTTTVQPRVTPLSDASPVGVRGIGDLALPLTVDELAAQTGQVVTRTDPEPGSTCSYLTLAATKGGPAVPADVWFMTQGDEVVRVEAREGAKVVTISGAGLGSTEAELRATYPRAVVRPNKYSSPGQPANDVVVTATSAKGSELVFETSKGVVTGFRSGQTDAVELVEGCY